MKRKLFNPIGLMVRECMDCNKRLGFKDGGSVNGVTHGICDDCFAVRLDEVESCAAA